MWRAQLSEFPDDNPRRDDSHRVRLCLRAFAASGANIHRRLRRPNPDRHRGRAALTLTAALVLVFLHVGYALASIDLFRIDGQPIQLSVVEQNREEIWNWFAPTNPAYDNRYNFLGSWLRLGAAYQLHGVKIYGEVMSPYFVNLPSNAIAPPPQGLLGVGANYYQSQRHANDASIFLKQGYLEFTRDFVEDLDLKGGRFEFNDGLEYAPSTLDQEMTWLLRNRISQRLVANFGFSDVMRSFDGAVASYGNDRWQATAMYGVPTKGAFDQHGQEEIARADVIYASLNVGPALLSSPLWGDSLGRLFYVFYSDTRGLPLVDNAVIMGATPRTGPVSIDTVGADYIRTVPVGPGVVDVLLWTAGQFGAWGTQSQGSYAYVVEGGYRLSDVPWKPWMRIGYTVASGDGDSHNSTHGTFFQILPTPRLYAFFPFYNMMNIDDALVQLITNPTDNLEIQNAIHGLWLDSSKDLWYVGGGAYNNKFFGFVGRPSHGYGYLGSLADCQITWKFNQHIALQLYYGHAFGGSVIGSDYPAGRTGDLGYLQTNFSL